VDLKKNIFIMATKIYQGNSTLSSKILYTWDGKYLYQGDSTLSSKILYTCDGKHLYQGNSTLSYKIILTVDGIVPIVFLLLAAM
jgi:hypothetical protein